MAALKHTNAHGKRSGTVQRKVVSLRGKGYSWQRIGAELEVKAGTARRIYDERMGEGAHYDSRLPGKGGRRKAGGAR